MKKKLKILDCNIADIHILIEICGVEILLRYSAEEGCEVSYNTATGHKEVVDESIIKELYAEMDNIFAALCQKLGGEIYAWYSKRIIRQVYESYGLGVAEFWHS